MTAGLSSLGALAAADSSIKLAGDAQTPITGITFDSRSVQPGQLFVALRGADYDGHDFVPDALSRGAAAVMSEQDLVDPVPQLVCPDTRATLSSIAAAFYAHPSRDVTVAGITGTDGKTTTAHLVDHILRAQGVKTGLVGTVAVRVADTIDLHASRQTTPESLDVQRYLRSMVDSGVEVAVLEATSHGLDLHRLDHVDFDVAAVTNITSEHLEHHKTVEAYRRAKGLLFERVGASDGTAVINLDDQGSREMLAYADGARILTYSMMDKSASLTAQQVKTLASYSRFMMVHEAERIDIRLPLIGAFNIANALCAAGICLSLGVPLQDVGKALAEAPPIPGRMATIHAGQPFSVIVDYAHTPESLAKVLQLLRDLQPHGRIIAVFGSAGERDRDKRPKQGEVAGRLSDLVVVTSEDPRHEDPDSIIEEIAAGARMVGARDGETLFTRTDRAEAIHLAISMARKGDQVLLAGKGHEACIIVGTTKVPWDEASCARRTLAELGWAETRGS